MNNPFVTQLGKSAYRLLRAIAAGDGSLQPASNDTPLSRDTAALIAADLVHMAGGKSVEITAAGRAFLARASSDSGERGIDPFRAQHLDLAQRTVQMPNGAVSVTADESESPLAWLARRKGRDGRALIEPHQFLAGERLRGEFTRAQLMPRTTSNWQAPIARDRRSGNAGGPFTDVVIAARQSLDRALDAVGPEFAGLLIDICCFLKGLADIERERSWPPRSAKIVLQLALDRLARHYGYAAQARGKRRAPLRAWSAPAADPASDCK